MRFISRISLFFIFGLACFFAGAYMNSKYLQWFYPGRPARQEPVRPDYRYEKAKEEDSGEETLSGDNSVPARSSEANVITCDTVLEVEEYDKNTDTTVIHEESFPGKYLGMDRLAFLDAMQAYEMSPPLEEQKRGLLSLEVLSFSRERIRLRKNYQFVEEEPDPCFYLVAENNFITVYDEEMKDVYMYTDIPMDYLPEGLQEEIIQRKLIAGESELYHFLESYSS